MKYNYAIYKNGRIIRTGSKTFKNEAEEESFTTSMIEKYTFNENDLVEVWYR